MSAAVPHARLIAAILLAGTAGCGGNFANENDELRARILELERRAEADRRRGDELEAALLEATRPPDGIEPEVAAATPMLTDIEVGRLSHAVDSDGDGRVDRAVVYLTTTDGRGRFVQVAGRLTLSAVVFPHDDEPVAIGQVTLSPGELRDAYRTGFSGTHYTVEFDIDPPDGVREGLINASCVDGRSGREVSGRREIQLVDRGRG